MKFGSKDRKIHINLKEFDSYHATDNCKGHFSLAITTNAHFEASCLGPILLPAVPTIRCPVCKVAIAAPQFEEWLEENIAHGLILAKGNFSKSQIKFLRQYFGFSQEQLGKHLGVDKFEMSKFESSKLPNRVMDPDKQLRMRLLCARILKIKEVDKILDLAEAVDQVIEIDKEFLPSEADVKKKFA